MKKTKRGLTLRRAVSLMHLNSRLVLMRTNSGTAYYVIPGGYVEPAIAEKIKQMPNVVPGKDNLFPGISQTWRIGVHDERLPNPPAPSRGEQRSAPWTCGGLKMDVTKYLGSLFLKVEDVRNAHRRVRIIDCSLGQYDKLDLTFEGGDKLSLNTTNVRTLARAYGRNSDEWVGKTIELFIGLTEYRGEQQDSILVRPVSSSAALEPGEEAASAPRRLSSDLDDEIPF
jgi:hypothetical protein